MTSRMMCAILVVIASIVCMLGCRQANSPVQAQTRESKITVDVRPDAVVIKSPLAEFEVGPGGGLRGFLLQPGKRLTLEEAPVPSSNTFQFDIQHARFGDVTGKIGALGKRVELVGRSETGLEEKTLVVEVYDDFPTVAIQSATYKNTGTRDFILSEIREQEHRLNAALADPAAKPYDMWSFQGASFDWGKDEVVRLSHGFTHQNVFGEPINEGHGGGIPVVAFWTAKMGEAIGHIETVPIVASIPVRVEANGRVGTSLSIPAEVTLKPGETYVTPRTFLAVFSGDFYEPLSLYSRILDAEGLKIPKPNQEDFAVAWCGWGYEFDVTPAQMTGTIPKLKELGIHWATLDDRWFANYGDWAPRNDTFPGNSIREMVNEFHKQGIKTQIWWLPIGVEDGTGRYPSHKYVVSQVVKDHPDWLILDKDGKPARVIRNLAALCPALPEVQAYYRKMTEKFIRDWDFDGHKLDNIYSVPACYNPKHHHKSPQDSTNAMAEVYREIFQSTRSLKPDSVTQICPCGTTPHFVWLPYMDQAVTADPVGGEQVRRRIKMYKALLGPRSAVYGDHVELSEMRRAGRDNWVEYGRDFASTIGTGGVVGTKFAWPEKEAKQKSVALTPEKSALWQKWIGLYNEKMLSQGEFRNLYTIGYDIPEGYVIQRDGRTYYAFFTPRTENRWKGTLSLRGLAPGRYRIVDYVNNKELATIDSNNPVLSTEFAGHLLLEATKQ